MGGSFLSHTMWCPYLVGLVYYKTHENQWWGEHLITHTYARHWTLGLKFLGLSFELQWCQELLSCNGALRIIGFCRFDKAKTPHSWWKQQCATKNECQIWKIFACQFHPQLFHWYLGTHSWFQPCICVCIFVLETVGVTPNCHSLFSFCLHNFYHCIVVLIFFFAIHHSCCNAKIFSSLHHDIGIVFDGDLASFDSNCSSVKV